MDHSPQFAFGIKHSPYLGSLKGDAIGGSKVEVPGNAFVPKPGASKPASPVANGTVALPNGTGALTLPNGIVVTTNITSKAAAAAAAVAAANSSSSHTSSSSNNVTTRIHSDGTRIRTETFSAKGSSTTTSARIAATRTTTTEVKTVG